jgi:hypothetical protein
MTAVEAGAAVGYTESTAKLYHWEDREDIARRAVARFHALTPAAMRVYAELLEAGKSEGVKLKAANRVLEGIGAGVAHKVEITHKTTEEIDAELLQAFKGDAAKLQAFLDEMRDRGTVH